MNTIAREESPPPKRPWMVSLHGGHSGQYCDHAEGSLREVLEAAVAAGFDTFGLSEHAPRHGAHLLYNEEKALGWDVAKLVADFEAYAKEAAELVEIFANRLTVLRGFETEAAPRGTYGEIMLGYRKRHAFDYMVGSVHHIDDVIIDGPETHFAEAREAQGGLEALAITYYERVAEMVETIRPEVVGHLDLIRKNAPSDEAVASPAIRRAALQTLEAIEAHGCILDVNTAGYRKGLGGPYPAPWLLGLAKEMNIGVCFGDDSHGPGQVGAGIPEARAYLLEIGIGEITALKKEGDGTAKRTLSL